jgi:D-alanine-D-alanine ligase
MEQRRVGVLMGGWGEEREISVKTGEAIATALETNGHNVTRVFAGPGLDKAVRSAQIDVAFLALHGRMGEDGRVQGLLEVLGIPYTGSGVLASALAMNKPFAKKLFRQHNLATPLGYSVRRAEAERALELHLDLGFPCVVKPAHGGSSVGLSVVHQPEQLVPAVVQACRFGGEALVERMVKGREVTVGILGNAVLGSCEISFDAATFDYQTKYQKGGARYHLPARMSATRVSNVEAMALAAWQSLGCRGYGRVDFLCSDSANDVVLEVNTLPGMTQMSLLPKIARHAGLGFEALVEQILAQASLDQVEVAPGEPLEQAPAERRAG